MPHCFGVPFVLGHVETMQNTRTHYARPKFIAFFMSFLKRVLKNGKSQGTGIERAFQQAMQLDAKLGKHGLRKQESTKCAEFWLRFGSGNLSFYSKRRRQIWKNGNFCGIFLRVAPQPAGWCEAKQVESRAAPIFFLKVTNIGSLDSKLFSLKRHQERSCWL